MVKIIGAGPGAKDLITVRGMRALQEADVISMQAHWSMKNYWNMQKKNVKFITVLI